MAYLPVSTIHIVKDFSVLWDWFSNRKVGESGRVTIHIALAYCATAGETDARVLSCKGEGGHMTPWLLFPLHAHNRISSSVALANTLSSCQTQRTNTAAECVHHSRHLIHISWDQIMIMRDSERADEDNTAKTTHRLFFTHALWTDTCTHSVPNWLRITRWPLFS